MSHQHDHKPDEKERDYSDADIHLKPLAMFFVITFISVGLCFVILRVIQNDLTKRNFDNDNKLPAFATERQLPPENMPRIQAHPLTELAVHRAYEKSLIDNGVSWADAGKTKARIPVTNAMEILISQPNAFPARTK